MRQRNIRLSSGLLRRLAKESSHIVDRRWSSILLINIDGRHFNRVKILVNIILSFKLTLYWTDIRSWNFLASFSRYNCILVIWMELYLWSFIISFHWIRVSGHCRYFLGLWSRCWYGICGSLIHNVIVLLGNLLYYRIH